MRSVLCQKQHNPSGEPHQKLLLPDWLCRPDGGSLNECARNINSTEIKADNSQAAVAETTATTSTFDCFYVYPTISNDPGGNSDMTAGPEEMGAVQQQFARAQPARIEIGEIASRPSASGGVRLQSPSPGYWG